jgi:hypothetical protein
MKPREQKNRDKTRAKKEETRAIKNQIKQRGKDNKTLSQKSEKGREKTWQNNNKKRRNRRSRFWHMNC